MTDLSMTVRKLHAFTYALAAIARQCTATEYPHVVLEHVAVLEEEIDKLIPEIERGMTCPANLLPPAK